MPKQTSRPDDDTRVSLREYYCLWLERLETSINDRFLAHQQAHDISAQVLASRLETLNEWKETTLRMADTYLTKDAHELFMREIEGKLRPLEDYKIMLENKASRIGQPGVVFCSGRFDMSLSSVSSLKRSKSTGKPENLKGCKHAYIKIICS